jgi:hypothetical protein
MEGDMPYKLKTPCRDCPFRHDVPGFLSGERAEEIANDVLRGSGSFPCHKTLDYSEDFDGKETKNTQMCAGATIFAEHCEQGGQMLRIAMRLGMLNPDELNMEAPVHTCEEDFLAHHEDE